MIILGYKPLDEKSVNFIIDNYHKLNYDEISEKLNISKSRVFAQCSELRKQGILKEKKKRYTWSFEDEELLKKMVENNLSIEDISKKINKQPNQIIFKIKKMRKENIINKNYKIFYEEDKSNFSHNVTTWTNEEEQKLLDNIKNMGLKKLSKTLSKSTFDTIMKYYELNEKSNYSIETYYNCKDYNSWSKEDDLYLIEHFERGNREKIIDNLNVKNWKKITNRAKMFGLKRDSFGTLYKSPNEVIVENMLKELDIKYCFQKRINVDKNKFYLADFVLENTNVILEAQGDYWHGNPKVFKNPSDIQLEKIANDKIRKEKLESIGYKVVYLWEYDLKNNYEYCKKLVIESFASRL